MNKYKTLLSNTVLISIGTFSSKLLVFFMVRFYTGCLTPTQYGTADLITQTANLLLPLISLGIIEGVFRFTLEARKDRDTVFTAGVFTITAGSLMFFLIVPILNLFDDFSGSIWLIVVYTICSCYHSLCSQFIRARGKTRLFAVQGIIATAIVITLNIVFLAVFDLGILGYVLSVVISDFLCAVMLIVKEKLWHYLVPKIKLSIYKKMLRYSIPLIPTSIFWWITSVSDRYMVSGYISSAANGIYSVAYKIPTVLTLLFGVFMEAWQYSAVKESGSNKREYLKFYSKVWSVFLSVMFLACTFMTAFSQIEILVLSDKSYFEAWQYVPVLCVAMTFSAFATFFGSAYMVSKKSIFSFLTALIGASVNILFNFLLIPSSLGIQGAAIATMISYIVVFIVRAVNTRKIIRFRVYTARIVTNTVVIAVQTVTILLQTPHWIAVQVVCCILSVMFNMKPVMMNIKKLLPIRKR